MLQRPAAEAVRVMSSTSQRALHWWYPAVAAVVAEAVMPPVAPAAVPEAGVPVVSRPVTAAAVLSCHMEAMNSLAVMAVLPLPLVAVVP